MSMRVRKKDNFFKEYIAGEEFNTTTTRNPEIGSGFLDTFWSEQNFGLNPTKLSIVFSFDYRYSRSSIYFEFKRIARLFFANIPFFSF